MSIALYLAFALVAIWAATRAGGRLSLRDALILLLLPLVEVGGPLVRGEVFNPFDSAWRVEPLSSHPDAPSVAIRSSRVLHDLWAQILPWQTAVRRAYEMGRPPLWNPFELCGAPLLASYQPAPFHPIHLMALLLDWRSAVNFESAATMLLAALSMFLLARELRCRNAAALFAAALWTYGSFFLFWIGWPLALTAAAAPLQFAAVLRLARTGGRRGRELLIIAWILLLTGGNPEICLFASTLSLAFFAVTASRRGRPVRVRRSVSRAAQATLVGLCLAAPQLLPFLEALPRTAQFEQRAAAHGVASKKEASPRDPADVWRTSAGMWLEQLVPFASGVEELRGEKPRPERAFATMWIGSSGLLLAIIGIRFSRSRLRWPLLLFWLVGTGLSIYLPPITAIFGRLPLFKLAGFRYGAVWASLCLCSLAALGAQAVLGGRLASTARRWLWGGTGTMVLLIGTNLNRFSEVGLAPTKLAILAAALIVPALVFSVAWRSGTRNRHLLFVLLALTLLERQVEMGDLHRGVPRRYLEVRPPTLDLLPHDGSPYRVIGIGSRLYPNLATLWGLEDARGYNPMALRRLVETYPVWAPRAYQQIPFVYKLAPFLRFLNVRFAFINAKRRIPRGWKEIWRNDQLRLVEAKRVLPRLFVPERVAVGGSSEERLKDLKTRRDFGRLVWIEPDGRRDEKLDSRRNGHCKSSFDASWDRYVAHFDCEHPAWVATSIPAWPGWSARSAGGRLPMGIANHAFVAFEVPAGSTDVLLEYRPVSFRLGVALAVLALVLWPFWIYQARSAAEAWAGPKTRH